MQTGPKRRLRRLIQASIFIVAGTGFFAQFMGRMGLLPKRGSSAAVAREGCDEAPSSPDPRALFDLPRLKDPSTLRLERGPARRVERPSGTFEVLTVHYGAWEAAGCGTRTLRIRGILARPAGAGAGLPGVVRAHGLSTSREEEVALELAEELGGVALAYFGPGMGGSEGHGPEERLFEAEPDPRQSWLWAHTVAALRGLTVVASLPEVDGRKLALTGISAGGLATMIGSGVDDRVRAAVVEHASAFADVAAKADPAPWTGTLLAASRRDFGHPDWEGWVRWLDPARYFGGLRGDVLVMVGAHDQYFPLDATARTLEALEAAPGEHRLYVGESFDHGPRLVPRLAEVAPILRESRRVWLRSRLGLDDSELPPRITPRATLEDGCRGEVCSPRLLVELELEQAGSWRPERAVVYASTDGALSFARAELSVDRARWRGDVAIGAGAPAWFVEVTWMAPSDGRTLVLTSRPVIPSGFRAKIDPPG